MNEQLCMATSVLSGGMRDGQEGERRLKKERFGEREISHFILSPIPQKYFSGYELKKVKEGGIYQDFLIKESELISTWIA